MKYFLLGLTIFSQSFLSAAENLEQEYIVESIDGVCMPRTDVFSSLRTKGIDLFALPIKNDLSNLKDECDKLIDTTYKFDVDGSINLCINYRETLKQAHQKNFIRFKPAPLKYMSTAEKSMHGAFIGISIAAAVFLFKKSRDFKALLGCVATAIALFNLTMQANHIRSFNSNVKKFKSYQKEVNTIVTSEDNPLLPIKRKLSLNLQYSIELYKLNINISSFLQKCIKTKVIVSAESTSLEGVD